MVTSSFDPQRTARDLIRSARRASLATLDEDGAPFASLVIVATAADGAPLLLLSGLARHTRNLRREPRVSLLVEDAWAGDPLAAARVTVSGTIAVSAASGERARFLARQPAASGYAGFADFALYRIEPQNGHLVAGFGRIHDLDRAALMTPLDEAEELIAREPDIVEHMNADHADATALYATRLLAAAEGAWRFDGLDPQGCELSLAGRARYLPFPQRLRGAGALRMIFKELAEQARNATGPQRR